MADTDIKKSVDEDRMAVLHATDALQAQEKLHWLLNQSQTTFPDLVVDMCHKSMDSLKVLKASLEKSDQDFEKPFVNEENLIELKQLTLMHVPASVTDEVKASFKAKVEQALEGQCKNVISITLLTCPWYERSQKERGEQAKHNILLVVFSSYDEQFFSPVNQQVKEQGSIIDFGWFCAVELSHFSQALARGRTRYVETVFCRMEMEVWSSREWQELKNSLTFQTATGTKSFLEASLGQAFGGIGKKRKNGGLKLREGASIFEICESLRLLRQVENSLRHLPLNMEVTAADMSGHVHRALGLVELFYTSSNPVKCKQELFDITVEWTKELRALSSKIKPAVYKTCQMEAEQVIGHWQMRTRLQGRKIAPCSSLQDSHSELVTLMQTVGGPVSKMKPEQIVLIAVAGSAMYNLNTASSDVDYTAVYTNPTEVLLSSTKKMRESYESRGVNKDIEYGAYEARSFCEMLLKCSVVILELVFAENHQYTSPAWKELCKEKQKFVTEKAVSQYLGLVKNNFKSIERGRHSESPKKQRKLFYQIFHKLHSLRSIIKGQVPEVKVEGAVREFIMNVRTQDSGEWSRENVLTEAEKQYQEFRTSMSHRKERLRENPDYTLCTKWLMEIRALL